jgi:Protein of unknown function (DUF1778)
MRTGPAEDVGVPRPFLYSETHDKGQGTLGLPGSRRDGPGGPAVTDSVVVAMREAERLPADRTHFVLEAEQWERFVELLDRSPQENPGLARLFARPSVFTSA